MSTVPRTWPPPSARGPLRVAAVLVLLAVVVCGLTRPPLGGYLPRARSGPGDSPLLDAVSVTLAVAGATLLLWLTVLLWRQRRRKSDDHEPIPVPLTGRLGRLIALVVVLLVCGTAGALAWWLVRSPSSGPGSSPAGVHGGTGGTHLPSGVTQPTGEQASPLLLVGVGIVAVSTLVAAMLVRRRRGPAMRAEQPPRQADLRPAFVAARLALRGADNDRDAILACYTAMESALRRHGSPRGAADTPSEHLHRAAVAGLVDAGTARELLTVFHRARFSEHVVYPADRQIAERALARALVGPEGCI